MVIAMIPKLETVSLIVGERTPTSRKILPNEIKGAATYMVTVPSGDRLEISSANSQQVINFLVTGAGGVTTGELSETINRLTVFAAMPGTPVVLTAEKDCCLLQIRMDIDPGELKGLEEDTFPVLRPYENCGHYRDYFKSEKTVSRTLIPPFKLPRFSMGSVQTTGPDQIQPHAHPVLDQLFFSFAENNCELLIDGEAFHFGGNCLLHIPRGSEHGIDATAGQTVHYLWVDFFEKSEDMEYLVRTHKPV